MCKSLNRYCGTRLRADLPTPPSCVHDVMKDRMSPVLRRGCGMASSQAADDRAGLARRRAMNVRRHPWDRWAPGVPARLPKEARLDARLLLRGRCGHPCDRRANSPPRSTWLRASRSADGRTIGLSAARPRIALLSDSRHPSLRVAFGQWPGGSGSDTRLHAFPAGEPAQEIGVRIRGWEPPWARSAGTVTGACPMTDRTQDPLRGVDARVRDEGRKDREAIQALRRIDRSDGAARTARDAVEPGVQRFVSRRVTRARARRMVPEGSGAAAAVDHAALKRP